MSKPTSQTWLNFLNFFLVILILIVCLLEAFTYPGLFQARLGISLELIVFVLTILLIILPSGFFSKKIKPSIFLGSVAILIIALALETSHYPNYLFSQWHFNYWGWLAWTLAAGCWWLGDLFKKQQLDFYRPTISQKQPSDQDLLGSKPIVKLRQWLSQNWLLVTFFFVLAIIMVKTPLYQDWLILEPSLSTVTDFWAYLRDSFQIHQRQLLVSFLVPLIRFPHLLQLVVALIVTGIVVVFSRLFKFSKRLLPLLFFILLIFSVSNEIRLMPFLYAGEGYLGPILFSGLYLYFFQKYSASPFNSSRAIGLSLIAFNLGNFMEHLGFAAVAVLGLAFVWQWWRTKKINWYLFWSVLAAGLGLLFPVLSLFSAQAHKEVIMSTAAAQTGLQQNLIKLIQLIFFDHQFLFVSLALTSLLTVLKSNCARPTKVIYALYLVFMTGLIIFHSTLPAYQFLNERPLFLIIFWSLFLLSFILPILKSKQPVLLFSIYLFGLLSLLPIMASAYAASRTISGLVLVFIIIDAALFAQFDWHRHPSYPALRLIIIFMLIVNVTNWLMLSWRADQIHHTRLEIIRPIVLAQSQQQWNEEQLVYLPAYPAELLPVYSLNPAPDNFYYPVLLNYYRLQANTRVVFYD